MKIFLICRPHDSTVSALMISLQLIEAGHTVDTIYGDKLAAWRDDPPRDDYGRVVAMNDYFYSLLGQPDYDEIVKHIRDADAVVFALECETGSDTWDGRGDMLVLLGIAAGMGKRIYGVHASGKQIGVTRRAVMWRAGVERMIEAVKAEHADGPAGRWKQD